LGGDIPPPIADGTEVLVETQDDPSLHDALRRLKGRRYEVVIANVRPRLFYDLVTAGLFAAPTLLWDRHLHDGIEEERGRRGIGADRVRCLPIRVWSFPGPGGCDLHPGLVAAGIEAGRGRLWPIDLEFFQSTASCIPDRVFAGGDSGRDWALFSEAVRGLPVAPGHISSRGVTTECTVGDALAVDFATRRSGW
jgi:hypothetical protein